MSTAVELTFDEARTAWPTGTFTNLNGLRFAPTVAVLSEAAARSGSGLVRIDAVIVHMPRSV